MNESLLKAHFAAYPGFEPRDVIKLCYQSAFGCGHLITDEATCTRRIREELAATPENPELPPFTPIGGGMARLNLGSPPVRQLSPKSITRLMLLTIAHTKPQPEALCQGMEMALSLAGAGEAPFPREDLAEEWRKYQASGCPMVSHSESYRKANSPAYRVILQDLCLLLPLLLEKKPLFVLDGPCGSGKTTLAGLLGEFLEGQVVPMDDFFLPPELRREERLSQPGGNLHRERFLEQVLLPLTQGKPLAWDRYDCATGQLIPREGKTGCPLIFEGSYSHHPAFAESYRQLGACRVWVDCGEEEQRRRLRERNPEKMKIFLKKWIPLEKDYFLAYDIPLRADVRIPSVPWEPNSLLR